MKTLPPKNLRTVPLAMLLFCSVSVSYAGDKQLYFFGGGGEPKGNTTIFDGHVKVLSRFINAKGSSWKASQSFNGGHNVTEKIIKSKLQKARSLGNFTESNFSKAMSDLENKLSSLKSGDQLLLIMDTHGAMNTPNEKSHSVSLSATAALDLKTLSGAKTVSMDEFEKLFTIASSKGVKLALLDLSCFSGNTLKISNKNTCVISATGENNYGFIDEKTGNDNSPYASFGGRFLERMKEGSNLEDIFLKARAGSEYADFPMISTDIGLQLNDLIYKMITPYLIANDDQKADFTESYDVKNLDQTLCKTQNQYSEIKKRIEDIANLTSIPKKLIDTTKLEKALDSYRNYQISFEKALSDSQKAGNEVKDIILRDHPDQAKLFDKEDGIAILDNDYEKSMKMFQELAAETNDDWQRDYYQAAYKDLLIKKAIAKDVSHKISAESKALINKFQDQFESSLKTDRLAENVSIEAKKLYDTLYRASSKKSNESNPCKDFVL